MEYDDDLVNDPIEHTFETKQFEVKRQAGARPFGKAHLMSQHPPVSQDERQGDKKQAQVRIARAGV